MTLMAQLIALRVLAQEARKSNFGTKLSTSSFEWCLGICCVAFDTGLSLNCCLAHYIFENYKNSLTYDET